MKPSFQNSVRVGMGVTAILRFRVHVLLIGLFLVAQSHAAAPAFKLIGHRGGVVEELFPDNSAAALKAAVARGYWGVEIDIRETKDGVLVIQHDADLMKNFGDPRAIKDVTWDEMSGWRTKNANQSPWRFEDVIQAAHDAGLHVMLDSKEPHSADFVNKVEAILIAHSMLDRSLIIGSGDALKHFFGKAPVGLKYRSLRPRLEKDPTLKDSYFLFDEGTTLTADMVKWAQSQGVRVVPSINVYHYYETSMQGKSRDEMAAIMLPRARAHIEALKALGVTEFQIDSEFDTWFRSF